MTTTTTPSSQGQANVMRQQAETIHVLVHLGFDLNAVVTAVTKGDLSGLAKG